jgi:hypothetical protein
MQYRLEEMGIRLLLELEGIGAIQALPSLDLQAHDKKDDKPLCWPEKFYRMADR